MPTFTRPATTDLLGTPSAPVELDVAESRASDPLDLGATGPNASGFVLVVLGRLAAFPDPTPAIRFQFSFDGSTWYDAETWLPDFSGPRAEVSRGWEGPPEARYLRARIDNGTGVPITAFVQGEPLAVG